MVKLDDRKIQFLCRHIVDTREWTTGQIAAQYGITMRRVHQLTKRYRDTGIIPMLNRNRRPKSAQLTEAERSTIDAVWNETRLGARLIYKELSRRGHHIPHHKIHKYFQRIGRTLPNVRKQGKRKRCRYERDHAFSLVHGDWHRTSLDHRYAVVWLDDASRAILSGAEFQEISGEHSIVTFKEAEKVSASYRSSIREVNTDRGSEFFSNRPDSLSRFQEYLQERNIRHIPSRASNPQTNGKVERFWLEYDRHRWRFASIDEFVKWYNNRLHGALWIDIGETPNEAIWRKLQPECILGFYMGWSGCEI
jgi:transposase InsO family protein